MLEPSANVSDLSQIALGRYQLISHPFEPLRMTSIMANINRLKKDVSTAKIVEQFFDNNHSCVFQFIAGILLA